MCLKVVTSSKKWLTVVTSSKVLTYLDIVNKQNVNKLIVEVYVTQCVSLIIDLILVFVRMSSNIYKLRSKNYF